MRKKTLSCFFDDIMWYLIYLLPILGYLVALFHNSTFSFGDYLLSFDLLTTNFVYTTFTDIFGAEGVVPLFGNNSAILIYASYFICMLIVHCAIDVLAFIPRLAHKWVNGATQQD